MNQIRALSDILQEIAAIGFRPGQEAVSGVEEHFDLLLFVAWHAWNESLPGAPKRGPEFLNGVKEVCQRHEIRKDSMRKSFVERKPDKLMDLMVAYKRKHFSNDHRFIRALEKTPVGTLRVYSEGNVLP